MFDTMALVGVENLDTIRSFVFGGGGLFPLYSNVIAVAVDDVLQTTDVAITVVTFVTSGMPEPTVSWS